MSSKFLLRFGEGKNRGHILNSSNLAAFSAMMFMPHAGYRQANGQETLAAMWMLALGATVIGRIKRWDVSLTFLGA